MEDYIRDMPILILGDFGGVVAEPPAAGLGDALFSFLPPLPPIIDPSRAVFNLIAHFLSSVFSVPYYYLQQYHAFCASTNDGSNRYAVQARAVLTAAAIRARDYLARAAAHGDDALVRWVQDNKPLALALGLAIAGVCVRAVLPAAPSPVQRLLGPCWLLLQVAALLVMMANFRWTFVAACVMHVLVQCVLLPWMRWRRSREY
ncbi:hypothetical protein SLS62_010353 [Diatrype stigma]|uniref:Uncharacterized protein n=1 Tax=Diatrype stigma TaxID=117547 RepID=A0AAN9UA65_9PEZI